MERTVRERFHFRLSLLDFQRNKHLQNAQNILHRSVKQHIIKDNQRPTTKQGVKQKHIKREKENKQSCPHLHPQHVIVYE